MADSRRPRRHTRKKRSRPWGWRNWALLAVGLIFLAYTVNEILTGGPVIFFLVVCTLILFGLAAFYRGPRRTRPHDPNWNRASPHSIATIVLDSEEAEWEEMARRKRERRQRREERARERERDDA